MKVENILIAKDIAYMPKGADYVVRCLNPDHTDRNPSMRIDKITGIFNCFSCNFKGNIFTLFGERINQLQMQRELLKEKIQEKAVENIGLNIPTTAVPYTGNWRYISPETYKRFEAFQDHSKEYIGRIIFPIRDMSQRIVAFIGRHTSGGTPKYLIRPVRAKMPLYPIVTPIKGSIILVEGIFDVLNLYDKGLPNVICCFGTQTLNEDKLCILKMQDIESIDIFFDGDAAGQEASINVKFMCEKVGLLTRNIHLGGQDPGDLSESQVTKLSKRLYQ